LKRAHIFSASVALALLAPVPLHSQPAQDAATSTVDQPISDEEARALFEAAEAQPLSGAFFAQMPAEITAQFDAGFLEVAAPGERMPGWPDVGTNLDSIVAAREGGAAASMTHSTGPAGILRTYFADRPFEAIVPAGWVLVGQHGERFDGRHINIEAGHMSPKVILLMRVDYSLRGRMRCHERSETRIYANPDVPASDTDAMALISALALATRIDRMGLCYGADEREPGVYVTRYYDREGHRLPELDAQQQPFRILPAEPFSASPGRP
jgi:hypothetical protein